MNTIISIDPGTEKCGLLLADVDNKIVLDCKVLKKESVLDLLKRWFKAHTVELIILGNGTNSRFWYSEILSLKFTPVKLVPEKGTTLRARDRYWQIYPPNCLMRFIPRTMLLPPKDLDAIAALVLLEDYLQEKVRWPEKIDFRI